VVRTEPLDREFGERAVLLQTFQSGIDELLQLLAILILSEDEVARHKVDRLADRFHVQAKLLDVVTDREPVVESRVNPTRDDVLQDDSEVSIIILQVNILLAVEIF